MSYSRILCVCFTNCVDSFVFVPWQRLCVARHGDCCGAILLQLWGDYLERSGASGHNRVTGSGSERTVLLAKATGRAHSHAAPAAGVIVVVAPAHRLRYCPAAFRPLPTDRSLFCCWPLALKSVVQVASEVAVKVVAKLAAEVAVK